MTADQRRVLAGATIGSTFGYGPTIVVSFALLIVPLMRDRGWSHEQIAMVISIKAAVAIFVAPLVGSMVDRWGSRAVVLVSSLLTATFLALVGLATNLAIFYILYALLIMASCGTMPTSYTHAITTHFDQRRGFAIGVVMAGIGVGSMIVPIVLQHATSTYGVRAGYNLLACLVLITGVPASYLIARGRAKRSSRPHDWGTAFRLVHTSSGTKLAIVSLLLGALSGATWGQLVPLMIGRGVHESTAALAMSGLAAAIVVSRIVSGYLMDRYFAPRIAALFFIPVVVACLLLAGGGSEWTAITAAIIFGIGLGAEYDFIAYLTGRYFPRGIYGTLYGLFYSMTAVGSGLSAPLFLLGRRTTGSDAAALTFLALSLVVATCLLMTLGRYPTEFDDSDSNEGGEPRTS